MQREKSHEIYEKYDIERECTSRTSISVVFLAATTQPFNTNVTKNTNNKRVSASQQQVLLNQMLSL